jgi:hypothetical protein
MTNPSVSGCLFTGSYVSEGDGVHMLNHCVLHPGYRWYSNSWPSSVEVVKHQELHRAQLEFEALAASDARGSSGDSGETRPSGETLASDDVQKH